MMNINAKTAAATTQTVRENALTEVLNHIEDSITKAASEGRSNVTVSIEMPTCWREVRHVFMPRVNNELTTAGFKVDTPTHMTGDRWMMTIKWRD